MGFSTFPWAVTSACGIQFPSAATHNSMAVALAICCSPCTQTTFLRTNLAAGATYRASRRLRAPPTELVGGCGNLGAALTMRVGWRGLEALHAMIVEGWWRRRLLQIPRYHLRKGHSLNHLGNNAVNLSTTVGHTFKPSLHACFLDDLLAVSCPA